MHYRFSIYYLCMCVRSVLSSFGSVASGTAQHRQYHHVAPSPPPPPTTPTPTTAHLALISVRALGEFEAARM
uniref:Putative secreted protein n=1 Tax=Anopheles triannulatus TaxID=58253 RepID=A0A2M4B2T3_9DIPT